MTFFDLVFPWKMNDETPTTHQEHIQVEIGNETPHSSQSKVNRQSNSSSTPAMPPLHIQVPPTPALAQQGEAPSPYFHSTFEKISLRIQDQGCIVVGN
jgi:hypothetical protein